MSIDLKNLLETSRTIAVIGCSNDPMRTSHHIAKYLKKAGFRMIPVHPDYEEVLGEKVYKSVKDIPSDTHVDIVDIFRNSDYTADMVDEVIERAVKTDTKPVIWTQLGVSSEEAKKKAEKAGLPYIEEKCLMVEHKRLMG